MHPSPSGLEPIDWADALIRHGRWLRLVVLARIGDRHAVEEIMQEVALAAVAQRSPLADPAKVAPWLHRLAVNKTLLYRRGRGRRLRMMDRQADRVSRGEHPTEQNEPLDWLVRDERNILIREAVERLPRRDAEILLLKYVENWSYRELADHLGLSSNAVESRLHRARARMRAELEEARVIEVRE